jgi:hypothetical protein
MCLLKYKVNVFAQTPHLELKNMSIAAQNTPDEGVSYLLNRLIPDLIGTLGACDANTITIAVDAAYDYLGSVYPLVGIKGKDRELLGMSRITLKAPPMFALKAPLETRFLSFR